MWKPPVETSVQLEISDVRILKFLVRVYPRTSTKDPRPRLCPQADAVSDPLSVRESAARLLNTDPSAVMCSMVMYA